MNDWIQNIQSFFVRLRLQEPKLIFRPRFQTTSLLLWAFALAGLLYGHLFHIDLSARTLSLLLSAIAALGALFVIALHDTWLHLRIYGKQLWGMAWLIAFGVLAFLSNIVWHADSADVVIKLTWTVATLLIGIVGVRLTYLGYSRLNEKINEYYPGMRSASVLMALFLINYILWIGQWLGSLTK